MARIQKWIKWWNFKKSVTCISLPNYDHQSTLGKNCLNITKCCHLICSSCSFLIFQNDDFKKKNLVVFLITFWIKQEFVVVLSRPVFIPFFLLEKKINSIFSFQISYFGGGKENLMQFFMH